MLWISSRQIASRRTSFCGTALPACMLEVETKSRSMLPPSSCLFLKAQLRDSPSSDSSSPQPSVFDSLFCRIHTPQLQFRHRGVELTRFANSIKTPIRSRPLSIWLYLENPYAVAHPISPVRLSFAGFCCGLHAAPRPLRRWHAAGRKTC